MKKTISDEEIAIGIVGIYYEEILHRGAKRRLDFDAIINTYFYVLDKLGKKDEMLALMKTKVVIEEKKLLHQPQEEMMPSLEALKEKVPQKM